ITETQAIDDQDHLVNYDNDNENDDLGYLSEEYFDEADEEDENNHSNGNVVKRGITKLYKFRREYEKPDGIKLSVTFDAFNRISGKHRALFSSFLGYMIREHIGLKILSWKKVDSIARDKLWDEITAKFDGMADEKESFVGYLINSKAFRVFKSRTRIVKENLHVQFSENTHNIARNGPNWLFDINALTKSIDYKPVVAGISLMVMQFKSYPDARFKPLGDDEKKMDVKSAFLYGKIEEEVYVCQPQGFEDPDFPDKVYKVEKALYRLHQAPRAWYETLSTYLLDNGFQRGKIDKTLFIRRDKCDILLVQVYVDDIIFGSIKKSLCIEFEKMMHKKFQMGSMGELTFFLGFTPMETQKLLLKDKDGEEVDVHLYRSMIGSLMYLTSSRPDIMFAVCACARYQVNPKVSHLHAVKRIFRYLKGQPKLGLWYLKDSFFDLVAYTDSDYAGASLDRKSKIGGCQFLESILISWQCKKQTVVENSTTEAKYVAASSCCGQVLWIRNQLLNYGDCNEKKLIQMVKLHTDKNVADLLTKAFDVKTINGEVQLQALVDGKKIIITKTSVRRDLQLNDEEGTNCLPKLILKKHTRTHSSLPDLNHSWRGFLGIGVEKSSQNLTFYEAFFSPRWKFLIHTILQCLSAKTTAWNEFSSTMASAIICLAANQKFNFSKYIFESMVKNLDNVGKFLMYPRFVQVFLEKQLKGMQSHKKIYVTPSHTKKIFRNMRRVGKSFSGRETPLFPTMMVQAQQEQGEGSVMPTDPQHTPTIIQPSTSQPQLKQRSRRPKRKDTEIPQPSGPTTNVADDTINEEMDC
ncbi:putative ribonuclease H-like domain-containing protein, partial [Tanacetum coccineum]